MSVTDVVAPGVPFSTLADTVPGRLTAGYASAADPERAASMRSPGGPAHDRTTSWWDTVDLLAAHVAGALVAADPALKADMDVWIADDDLWIARTALLHQLRYEERTDTENIGP